MFASPYSLPLLSNKVCAWESFPWNYTLIAHKRQLFTVPAMTRTLTGILLKLGMGDEWIAFPQSANKSRAQQSWCSRLLLKCDEKTFKKWTYPPNPWFYYHNLCILSTIENLYSSPERTKSTKTVFILILVVQCFTQFIFIRHTIGLPIESFRLERCLFLLHKIFAPPEDFLLIVFEGQLYRLAAKQGQFAFLDSQLQLENPRISYCLVKIVWDLNFQIKNPNIAQNVFVCTCISLTNREHRVNKYKRIIKKSRSRSRFTWFIFCLQQVLGSRQSERALGFRNIVTKLFAWIQSDWIWLNTNLKICTFCQLVKRTKM